MATARVKSSLQTVIAVLGAVVMSMLFVAVPGAEASHGGEPHDGNPTCEDLQPDDADWAEFRIEGGSDGGDTDQVDSGTYEDPDGPLEVEITVHEDTETGPTFDWSSNIGVDAVFAKGGDAGHLFRYDPEEMSDTGLHAPENDSGKYAGLSHISFCYDVPPEIGLVVDKVNDADQDGTFSDSEESAPGAAVDFRVTITNPDDSEASVDLSSATDTYPADDGDGSNDSTVDLFDVDSEDCDLSDDTVLEPGGSVTCTFTIEDYGPAPGASIDDTVTVEGHEVDNPDNTTSDQDDSTVETPPEEVLGDSEERESEDEAVTEPDISVTKTALVEPDEDGRMVVTFVRGDGDDETVTYRYTVTNTGDTTLEDLELTDDVLGTITLDDTTLAPGESTTATATHVLIEADAADGEIVNVATAVGAAPDGEEVSASDDARVLVAEVQPATLERSERLAATGADAVGWAALAIGMIVLGGTALLATRQRASAV